MASAKSVTRKLARFAPFDAGEKVRIRVKGPRGQPFESFLYTVSETTVGREPIDIALQFAQTLQPGMIVEVVGDKVKWAYEVGSVAGLPSVTRVRGR